MGFVAQWRQLLDRLTGERGSALMEFAVSLPLFSLMLAAGTATALVIQAQFVVHSAAMEGATIGANIATSIDPYNTAVEAARQGAERVLVDHGLDLGQATITFEGTSPELERGTLFQVQIEYNVQLAVPLARSLRGDGGSVVFVVRSVGVMPIQQYKARWPCPSPDPICN